jgi:hypothetical protein
MSCTRPYILQARSSPSMTFSGRLDRSLVAQFPASLTWSSDATPTRYSLPRRPWVSCAFLSVLAHHGASAAFHVCRCDQGQTCMDRRFASRNRHDWILEFDRRVVEGVSLPQYQNVCSAPNHTPYESKLLLPWRFFRLWALADGIDPPENMVRCMANNYSTLGFWRSWHRSYNLWITR